MAIARTKAGLSAGDLETVRAAVAAGRKPKVVFTDAAGQIAGRTGQVTRLEDPAAAEEWVVVRFGKDELPFAPSDLQFPPKPSPIKGAPKVQSVPPPQWTPASVDNATKPVAAESADAIKVAPVSASGSPANGDSARAATSANGSAGGATSTRAATNAVDAPAPAAKPARKSGSKRPPELTVTLAHEDGHWTVQAQRGAKVLVKPAPVRAADALKMVGMLDVPPVHAVVEEIVEAARVEAEHQAERLRRELAEVEAALADLNDLG